MRTQDHLKELEQIYWNILETRIEGENCRTLQSEHVFNGK